MKPDWAAMGGADGGLAQAWLRVICRLSKVGGSALLVTQFSTVRFSRELACTRSPRCEGGVAPRARDAERIETDLSAGDFFFFLRRLHSQPCDGRQRSRGAGRGSSLNLAKSLLSWNGISGTRRCVGASSTVAFLASTVPGLSTRRFVRITSIRSMSPLAGHADDIRRDFNEPVTPLTW